MEGICGLVNLGRNSDQLQSKIRAMLNALSDGDELVPTILAKDSWALACAGWVGKEWKPITFAYQDERLALVAVGDVFNFDKLADELRIDVADKAAILAENYRTNPHAWAEKIHGNFAVIIYDQQRHLVVAAVDRLGIRPLCWMKRGDFIYMGSRLNVVKAAAVNLDINPSAIYAFIQHEMIPAPMTIYKDVQKLEPGYTLTGEPAQVRLARYWDITAAPKLSGRTDDIAKGVYEKLDAAVLMMSNGRARPDQVGGFLSGGTDSSSICGLMSQQQSKPVDAFSIGFTENGYDEMSYARIAAKAFGLRHHQFYTQPHDVLKAFPMLMRAYDEPFGNSSIIPAYFCALEAKKNGIDYLLAGDGGDELFGGNERYSMQQVFRNYFKAPALLRKGLLEPMLLDRLEKLPIGLLRKAGSYVRRANLPEVERIYSYKYVSDDEVFDPTFLTSSTVELAFGIANDHFARMSEAGALDRHLYLDMKMTIADNDLVKVTHMTEAAGIRVRYPMLDQDLVDYAFRIPAELKLAGTQGLRFIFKRAVRDLLPVEIIKKPKHGFGLPIAEWLRNNQKIKQFTQDLLFDSRLEQRGYFKKGFIEHLWTMQLNDQTPYYGTLLWKFIVLESWHRIHVEQESL